MKASEEITIAIVNNLGFHHGTVAEVKNGVVNVIDCGEFNCIITCTENDKPYIDAMIEMVDNPDYKFKVIVKQGKARVPKGTGFGDKVWRYNAKHKGIEISFNGTPEESVRTAMKTLGFRWSRISGVWYISTSKSNDTIIEFLKNFEHVTDI